MPNKLLIKANFCDLRNVKEETLAAYDVIEVRANVVVLNDRARELIARYPVTLKCDLATDTPNIALRSVNGVVEVTPGDVPEADTVLTVNGELKIASGSAEVLARYLQITVNGQVYCPRSLSGKLGNVAVNGQIITWPDGAGQLGGGRGVGRRLFHRRAGQHFCPAGQTGPVLGGPLCCDTGPRAGCRCPGKAGRAVRYAQGDFGPKPCRTGRPAV